MELDDLKAGWGELGRRIDSVESMVRADYRARRFASIRRMLQLVGAGQALQALVWIGVIAVVAPFWIAHRHVPHLLVAGLSLHAYGVLAICAAVVQLVVTGRLYYTSPIVECQKRLAELERVRIVSAVVTGLPWWVLWVPAMLVGAKAWWNIDLYAQSPAWIHASLAFGVAGMAASLWIAQRLVRPASSPWVQRLVDDLAGRSLRRVRQHLADVEQFAHEGRQIGKARDGGR